MAACVATLEAEGMRVGGLLQRRGAAIAPGRLEMLLTFLPGWGTISLEDRQGAGASGCRLDVHALARAAMALREAVASHPDLIVVNRFGKEEAAGGGLRAEIATAILDDLPVLIGVRRPQFEAWQTFLGAEIVVLPPLPGMLLAWARKQIAQTSLP